MQHIVSGLLIFPLPLDYQEDAIYDFSFERTGSVSDFMIEYFKRAFRRIVELR
jgi:hypothetical protein